MTYPTIELTPLIVFILVFGVGAIFYLVYTFVELIISYLDWRRTHG